MGKSHELRNQDGMSTFLIARGEGREGEGYNVAGPEVSTAFREGFPSPEVVVIGKDLLELPRL